MSNDATPLSPCAQLLPAWRARKFASFYSEIGCNPVLDPLIFSVFRVIGQQSRGNLARVRTRFQLLLLVPFPEIDHLTTGILALLVLAFLGTLARTKVFSLRGHAHTP